MKALEHNEYFLVSIFLPALFQGTTTDDKVESFNPVTILP